MQLFREKGCWKQCTWSSNSLFLQLAIRPVFRHIRVLKNRQLTLVPKVDISYGFCDSIPILPSSFIFHQTIGILNNKISASTQTAPNPQVLNNLIVDAIQDNKGKEIALFDMRQLEDASTDFFIICHGTSNTQIAGILKNIERRVREELGIYPNHLEGKQGTWMLIDYFSVIVHIFSAEKREFYQLDDLWSDALVTTYES